MFVNQSNVKCRLKVETNFGIHQKKLQITNLEQQPAHPQFFAGLDQ
jgi:hypothetical protein